MAKEIFAQMAAGLDSNRKIMKAGRDGRDVFLWVLRQIASRASDGWVPAREVEDYEWLSRVLMCKPREARDGLAQAISAELLKLDGDRCYAVGWTTAHGRTSQTGAERQARYIERKNAKEHDGSDGPVTEPSASDEEVTVSDAVTQGSKEVRKEIERAPSSRRKKPVTSFPANFEPEESVTRFARENGLDLTAEAERFKDHHLAKGSQFADWQAALRTWLKNAVTFRAQRGEPVRSGIRVVPNL